MKKNIETVFRDQFEHFESQPSEELWNKIVADQRLKKYNRSQSLKRAVIYSSIGIIAIVLSVILITKPTDNLSPDFMNNTAIPVDTFSASQNVVAYADTNTSEVTDAPVTVVSALSDTASKELISSDIAVTSEVKSVSSSMPASSPLPPAKIENHAPSSNQHIDNKVVEKMTEKHPIEKYQSEANETAVNVNPVISPTPPAESENSFNAFSIPSAFTPDGDGLNDVFRAVTAQQISNFEMTIFSVSGQRVFISRDIQYGWDGEMQGAKMPNGTYVYVIRYKDDSGENHIKKGQISLIR